MILVNIACIMVASMEIFPNNSVIYGSAYSSLTDEDNLPSAVDMFNIIIDPGSGRDSPSLLGLSLGSWAAIYALIVAAVVATAITHSPPQALAAAVTVGLFVVMFNNARMLFDSLTTNFDSKVQFISLMIGVSVIIALLWFALDYWSGQNKSDI
jgi:hypothetical protein